MHIGPLGLPEIIIIIVVIVALVGGPKLFKKIGNQGKKTLEAGKKGIENASKEITGNAVEMGKITKDNALDAINKVQDHIDEKFDEINDDGTPKETEEEKKTEAEAEKEAPAPEAETKAEPSTTEPEADSKTES